MLTACLVVATVFAVGPLDVSHFPPDAVLDRMVTFLGCRLEVLRWQYEVAWQRERCHAEIVRLERMLAVWNALRYARYWNARQGAWELYTLIGAEAFGRGEMPLPY